MKAFLKYTLARLGLFVVVFVLVWAITNALHPWPVPFVLIAAFIVSGVVSIFLLRGMREEVAAQVVNKRSATPTNRDVEDLD